MQEDNVETTDKIREFKAELTGDIDVIILELKRKKKKKEDGDGYCTCGYEVSLRTIEKPDIRRAT